MSDPVLRQAAAARANRTLAEHCRELLLASLRDSEEEVFPDIDFGKLEREFWERFGAALERLADRHLAGGMRRRLGPEDVVQSACRSFFRRARLGQFQMEDSGALWRILCAITLTKVAHPNQFDTQINFGDLFRGRVVTVTLDNSDLTTGEVGTRRRHWSVATSSAAKARPGAAEP